MNGVCLLNQDSQMVDLSVHKGKWIILYFYPKDSTPGCTTEAVEFSALKDEFDNENCLVFGVSADSIASHKKFQEKQNLSITLLSDPDKKIIEQFGAFGEKNMYGKKVMGIIRTTILFNPEGEEVFRWKKVKAAGHAAVVLEDLKKLKNNNK